MASPAIPLVAESIIGVQVAYSTSLGPLMALVAGGKWEVDKKGLKTLTSTKVFSCVPPSPNGPWQIYLILLRLLC